MDNLFQFQEQRRAMPIGIDFIRMMLLRFVIHNTFFVDPNLSKAEGLEYIDDYVEDLMDQFHGPFLDLADGRQPSFQELLVTVEDEISQGAIIFLEEVREKLVLNATLMFLHNRSIISSDPEEKALCNDGVVSRIFARERLLGRSDLSLAEISLYVAQTFFRDDSELSAVMSAMYSKWDKPSGLPVLMSNDAEGELNFKHFITLILHLDANRHINQIGRVVLNSALGIGGSALTNPLLIAVMMQDPESISDLIDDHFADVNTVSSRRLRGVQSVSALSLACAIPNVAMMRTLLSHEANANALFEATQNRQSALSLVLSNYFSTGNEAYFEMARMLLRFHANSGDELLLTTVPNGWPAITRINLFGYFIALAEGMNRTEEVLSRLEEILVLLVQHGVNIHYSDQTNQAEQTHRDLYLEHLGGLNLPLRRQFELLYNHAQRTHAEGLMSPPSFPSSRP